MKRRLRSTNPVLLILLFSGSLAAAPQATTEMASSHGAFYRIRLPADPNPSQVSTLRIAVSPGEEKSGATWGMSLYGQAEPDLRFASMKLAYDLGAEFIWFWTSDHDHHVPYTEQLRLARKITEYVQRQPPRDLTALRQAAGTAIVLPYGYTLPTTWQLFTWGTHIYPLSRKNPSGLTYKEVLRPAIQEIARCLKEGVAYDVVPAGEDFDPNEYERVLQVEEDGTCRLAVRAERK